MSLPFRTDADPEGERQLLELNEDDDLRAMLKPVIAGARARGVADGLEMLGVGAVLMDATGRVLHVGGRGRRLMGGWLRIIEDHLVAERSDDNRAVEDLVSRAIAGTCSEPGIRLGSGQDGAALAVKALPFVSDEGVAQRLHAVLILDEIGPA